MANIFTDVEKGIEVGAADALKVLTMATTELPKITAATPVVAAALGTLLGQVSTAVSTTSEAAAASGLNFSIDAATLAAIKGVWPDVTAFLATLGVKL